MPKRSRGAVAALVLSCVLLFAVPSSAAAFGPVLSFGSGGSGAGELYEPGNIAVAPDGTSYVADYGNDRVDVFDADGSFSFAFGSEVNPADEGDLCTAESGCQRGAASGDAGAMSEPEGIALASNGNVYVTDYANERIDVFTSTGRFLFAFGDEVNLQDSTDVCTVETGCGPGSREDGAGGMDSPTGIEVGSEGRLYVADNGNSRVDVFTAAGGFLYAFGREVDPADGSDVCTASSGCQAGALGGGAGAMFGPTDVAVGSDGTVFLTDRRNNRIEAFTPAGEFLYAFGRAVNLEDGSDVCTASSGCAGGEASGSAGGLVAPTAIAIGPTGDVYVADFGNERVAQFAADGSFVRAFGEGVVDGADDFQVCTAATGCEEGRSSTAPGAITSPFGLALDCRGAVYAVEGQEEGEFSRVERFAEPGTPLCGTEEGEPAGSQPGPVSVSPVPPSASTPGPSNRFKLRKVKHSRKHGTATIVLGVPGPGKVALKGRGVRGATRHSGGVETVKLLVRAVGGKRRALSRRHRVKLRVAITFTPAGGSPATRVVKVVLRKQARRHHRHRG
jgi:hypothetical protein